MLAVYVACFVLGLLLAVWVMLHGVERPVAPPAVAPHEAGAEYERGAEPSPWLNGQNGAAFVAAFGLVGYLLTRGTAWPAWGVLVAAAAAGAAGVALSIVLLAKWALPSARKDPEDPRYLLQGHPATVTRAIDGDGEGEIAYEADGRRWTARARSWDGAPLAAGTEVAIERVEDGVAFVEQWAAIEARL